MFFLESIMNRADGTAVNPTLTQYESKDEAERAYHHVLADNIDNEDIDFVRCTVINAQGGVEQYLSESWKAEAEVDPEEPAEPDTTKYYFTQIRYKTDATIQRGISVHDTKDAAVVAFHNLLYGTMDNAQYKAIVCRITDKYGNTAHDTRFWERRGA